MPVPLHTASKQLIERVLQEFQKWACDTAASCDHAESEHPPKECYVEYFGTTPKYEGKPVESWLVNDLGARSCRVRRTEPEIDLEKRFLECAYGSFWFSKDLQTLHFNWEAGPRYGIGLTFSIKKQKSGKFILTNSKKVWVS